MFAESHREIGRVVRRGLVDGLRVDHPDGLRDPRAYLDDLARLTGGAYVLVEKILEPGEALPTSWATAGTTGYDVLAHLDRVLTDPAGQAPLDALEARLRGAPVDWASLTHDTRRAVADRSLRAEVRRIVRELPGFARGFETVAAQPPQPAASEDAVAEVLACFPVYRSYLPEGREHLDEALATARRHRPDLADVFDRLAPVLGDPEHPAARRFQQTSGMVMAKGVEDCAFYRFSRLTSLNEVGGDPDQFALDPARFHELMAERQRDWPTAMTTTTTHDTKRSEDTRARIAVLAEIPDLWADSLGRLLELAPLPDAGFGSLLWQAVLGAWPASRERLHAYAEKAMREAGDHTTWTDPDVAYETAVHAAVDAAFDSAEVRSVLDDLMAATAGAGRSNGLALKLLALTVPGVPDVYPGHRAVGPLAGRPRQPAPRRLRRAGAAARRRAERSQAAGHHHRPAAAPRPARALHVVRRRAGAGRGSRARARLRPRRRGHRRHPAARRVGARGGWGDTTLALPAGEWRDALTGVLDKLDRRGAASCGSVAHLPVALLVKEG